MPTPALMGARVRRKEDPRLLTGRANYVGNITLPALRHAAFVRSPYAHAGIRHIDVRVAVAMPGVYAVVTGSDFAPLCPPLSLSFPADNAIAIDPQHTDCIRHALAIKRVRHVGEALAVVIADTPEQAEDAALAVLVDWEPLPVAVGVDHVVTPSDAPIFASLPDNVVYRWRNKTAGVDEAFASAAHVVRQRMVNQRLAGVPLEGRATLVAPDPLTGGLTVWMSTQVPHAIRTGLARLLRMPENLLRVIAPDVGGGFGVKDGVFPEDAVLAILARHYQVPLRWIETRSEHMQATTHGRDQITDVEAAVDAEGNILAMRLDIRADLGAYPIGTTIPPLTCQMAVGVYRIPKVDVQLRCILTNTTPVLAYRGAGRPEATYYLERIIEIIARELKLDPIELRRKNFILSDAFPYTAPTGLIYDSGDYDLALRKVLEIADYPALRAAQRNRHPGLPLLGIGLSCYTELCTFGYESATVRVDPSGTVTAFTGLSPHGQGTVTTLAQIVADQIGADFDRIQIQHGDTSRASFGMGTAGSRGVAVGGSAVYLVAGQVREKARRIAAHMLEAAVEDIVLSEGQYHVRGSSQPALTLVQIAERAYSGNLPEGMNPGLEATDFFKPGDLTFPFGAHLAVVEIDQDTGEVTLRDFFAVDDCGTRINPMLADGQIHGGLAQGIAQALWEEVAYDPQGQLLSGTLMEYALPRADRLPHFVTAATVTPTPRNPLGAKGLGEAATIGSTPAVVNAVLDALNLRHLDMPLLPQKVWQALQKRALQKRDLWLLKVP